MTAALAVSPSHTETRRPVPAVRIRPVPPLEPPTDDELRAADWEAPPVTAPALPLEWPAGHTSRRPRGGAPDLDQPDETIRPRGGMHPHGDTRPGTGAPEFDLSPAQVATRRFLAVCLEVMGGYRPVTHLRPLCVADAFAGIAHHLTGRTAMTPAGRTGSPAHLAARTPVVGRPVTGAPPRTGRARQAGPAAPVAVRRVLLCEPREGAAEVAVVMSCRDKVWATVIRLEERAGRWLCTFLRAL